MAFTVAHLVVSPNNQFSGSPKGAEESSGIYTLIETAKANGLSPMKYIQDIPETSFLEYPEYLEEYMPWDPLIQKLCRYSQPIIITEGWLFLIHDFI